MRFRSMIWDNNKHGNMTLKKLGKAKLTDAHRQARGSKNRDNTIFSLKMPPDAGP